MMRSFAAAALIGLLAGCGTPGAAPSEPAASHSVSDPPSTTPSSTQSAGIQASSPSPSPSSDPPPPDDISGVDVSGYQPDPDWATIAGTGHRFAFIKATEGTGYISPVFWTQWSNARAHGLITGAYHYARPAVSSGAEQARYLVSNGGGWTPDGQTLPAALDIEEAESGDPCHGLTQEGFADWVGSFVDEYHAQTGRAPIIYVKQTTWDRCIGSTQFGEIILWLFDHEDPLGPLPMGWQAATFWQFGVVDELDRNVFFGDLKELHRLTVG